MATVTKSDQPPLQKRAVAGSFIFKYPKDGGRPLVALFKRSDKVRTYPHKLGSISGTIEAADASPLAAAWRELREETTLTSSSLELLRTGKPYSFGDASVGREWSIHPFAFRLKTTEEGGRGESGITIDWEHQSWEWHDPADVVDSEAFGGVPRIAESLRRVWFEKDLGETAGAILARGIHELKTDHQSGARQMAGHALELFRNVVQALEEDESWDRWWANVRFAAWHIWKNGRESMGAAILSTLLGAMGRAARTIQQHQEWSVAERKAKVLSLLQECIEKRQQDPAQSAARAFADYVANQVQPEPIRPVSILTLSESSTISKVLFHLVENAGVRLDLRVLESRPLFEGVSFAGGLINNIQAAHDTLDHGSATSVPRVQATMYTDAAVALAAENLDIVLLGADRIAGSGAVSNKIGSLPAVLSTKHVSPAAKVVVLSESEKIAPPGDARDHVIEENSPTQVVRTWSSDHSSDRVRDAAATLVGGVDAVESDGGTGRAKSNDGDGALAVRVRNVFFEWVGPELIDAYVTELGVWSLEEIKTHSEALAIKEQTLFGDL